MRVVLFADLHLDTPFVWAGREVARRRRQRLRDVLTRIAELAVEEPEPPVQIEEEAPEPPKPARPPRARKGKPPVPAWEDVLLGVRSSGRG